MQLTMHWSKWRSWRHALIFGIPLGVLELGLIYITISHNYWLSPQQATLIGWLLCLLIPGVAGYHICYWGRRAGSVNGWAGLRVGVVGSAVVMIGFAVWLVVALIIYNNTPPPSGPRTFYSPDFALFVAVMLFGLLAMINFVGLTFSAVGGRIGEALAAWRIKRFETHGQCSS